MSLPLRECGLKSEDGWFRASHGESLPLRECGLKYVQYAIYTLLVKVTPLAGVWIEIILVMC